MGEYFHRVAHDMIPEDWLDNEEDDGHWFIPSIVNMAFACELYLKSMLSNGESETRGHDLSVLFHKLTDEQKTKVLNSASFKDDNDFHSNLIQYKNIFEEWRYCFEAGRTSLIDVVFLENFAIVLHDVAESEL